MNSPLGDCPKVHKLILHEQMDVDPHKEKHVKEYEKSLCSYLHHMVGELDARIVRERKHLQEFGSDTKRRRIMGLPPMNTEQLVEHRVGVGVVGAMNTEFVRGTRVEGSAGAMNTEFVRGTRIRGEDRDSSNFFE